MRRAFPVCLTFRYDSLDPESLPRSRCACGLGDPHRMWRWVLRYHLDFVGGAVASFGSNRSRDEDRSEDALPACGASRRSLRCKGIRCERRSRQVEGRSREVAQGEEPRGRSGFRSPAGPGSGGRWRRKSACCVFPQGAAQENLTRSRSPSWALPTALKRRWKKSWATN